MIHQHEIDAQIQTAMETKMRNGYTTPACICRITHINGTESLGFIFHNVARVGHVLGNSGGSEMTVLALV